MGELNELALFAGAGGGILGSKLLGWDTQCAVEIDPYCQKVLLARQRDGILPCFPIWDDIKTFDGRPWRGLIDVVTGGFPCQDISSAGKGQGITGNRSSLFFEMLRIIKEVRPTFVFAENSPNLRSKGLGAVVEGLTRLGFVGAHGVLGAWHVGAPHRRKRIWIVACHPNHQRESALPINAKVAGLSKPRSHTTSKRPPESMFLRVEKSGPNAPNPSWWETEPKLGRVADRMANRVDRLKAIGNGQVPLVAKTAWQTLAPIAIELAKEN